MPPRASTVFQPQRWLAIALATLICHAACGEDRIPDTGDKGPAAPPSNVPDESKPVIMPGSPAELVSMLPSELVIQPWDIGRLVAERTVSQTPFDSPEYRNALLMVARYAAAKGHHGESILYYERWRLSAKGDPRMAQVLIEAGRQYREMALTKNALDYFYRAIRITKGDINAIATRVAQWEVAETWYRAHDWERARKLFEMVADSNQQSSILAQSAYYRMGDCSRALGNSGQAIIDYQRALANNDRHPFAVEARLALLEIFLQRDNQPLAHQTLVELTQTVARLTPQESHYWKLRSGEVLFREMARKRSYELSSEILDALAPLDPAPSWQGRISFWRGLTNIGTGQWNNSLVNFTNIPPAVVKDIPVLSSAPRYADTCRWILSFTEKEQELNLPEPTP